MSNYKGPYNSFSQNAEPIYNQRNILGAVSQSDGVPTEAIIERGSNANGEFVRYADGTQICWIESYDGGESANIPIGNVFRTDNQSYTFPVEFSEIPAVNISSRGVGLWAGNSRTVNSSGISGYIQFSATSRSGDSIEVRIIAIGRWY